MIGTSSNTYQRATVRAILLGLAAVFCLSMSACVGGMPRVPNAPDDILTSADRYFERHKYVQSAELYKAFLQRYPGHDRSDYAQFRLAESYYGQREWLLAAVEYRILVTNYGYSDYVDDGYYREGLCYFELCPKPQLDQTKCQEGLEKLRRFVQVFSNSPLVPEALEYIDQLQAHLARKEIETALYYYKKKLYISSLIYLNKIIDNYPNNVHWCRAHYYKATIFYDREEDIKEVVRMLSQVLDCEGNFREKSKAQSMLHEINPRQSQK
jgi:outer membrane assembly lipoprotein YfiO